MFRLAQLLFFILTQTTFLVAQNYLNNSHCLSMEDGLSNAIVNHVYQDSRGFIWLATNYGLNRYDGYHFEVFTKETSGLSENRINCVGEDFKGNLWIGCGELFGNINQSFRGVDILNPITQKVVPLETYFKGQLPFELSDVWRLQGNWDETIWIMTKKGILFEYNKNGFEQILTLPKGVFFPEKAQLFKTPQGKGWATVSDLENENSLTSLLYFEPKKGVLEHYQAAPNILAAVALVGVGEGIFFEQKTIATIAKSGINCYKKEPLQAIQPISFLKNASYTAAQFISTLQQIWAFSNNDHNNDNKNIVDVFDLNGRYLTSFNKEATMGYGDITWMDNQQGVWSINDYYNTVCVRHLNKSLFQKHHAAANATEPRMAMRTCVYDAAAQQLYAGGDYFSILNLKSNQEQKFKLTPAYALSILKHSNGNWYVSDEEGTVAWWNGNANSLPLKLFKYPENAGMGKMLWTMKEDAQNRIWIGGSSGLSCLEVDSQAIMPFKNYETYQELSHTDIFHFHQNKKGWWIASGTGLYLFDPLQGKILERYHIGGDAQHFLPYNTIAHICEDKKGIFWLATKGGGMIKWNPNTKEQQQFTTKEGLSHNIIYGIYEDDYSNLWMSSDYGIMRFNKQSNVVNTYHVRDGISHEEFNTLSHCQLPDGSIFFGGINGLTSFHPKDFQVVTANSIGQLHFTKIEKRNEETGFFEDKTAELLPNNFIQLSPNEQTFQVHFSSLDFQAAGNNSYAYLLEGVDKNWTYTKQPVVILSNLPYGSYTLKIKAQGANGLWLKKELSINVFIEAPFYRKWWFIIVSVLVGALGVFGFVQWRLNLLKNRQAELERIVEERTAQIENDKKIITEQAEDLKALDQLKTRFFANISHELRTPLTLILGPLSSILERPEELTPQLLAQHRIMNRNGKKLLELIEEILDLSKLDAHKLEVNETAQNLYVFLKKVCSVFESPATYQKILFQFEYELSQDLQVFIDGNKVEKIINNLLSNAFKFTPAGGTITVHVFQKDQEIAIAVKDTGQGIPAHDLPRIFDRFFQSKQANQPIQGGTGIGLALAYELAMLMGGTIEVTSTLQQGSNFLLRLPLKEATNQAITTEIIANEDKLLTRVADIVNHHPKNANQAKYKVLVVEDNEDMRFFIESLLIPYYEVTLLENGQLAWDYINNNQHKIDLIISDVMMPVMDGFALLKRIKDHETWQKIPVIMLTARAAERDKLRALVIGVDDYLLKPFSNRELLARVHNVLLNYTKRLQWSESEESIEEVVSSGNIFRDEQHPKEKQEAVADIISLSYNEREWIQQVEDYTKKYIANTDLSVAEIAANLYMSERQFRRNLQKITGLSPTAYIKEIRLTTARQLIESKKYDTLAKVSLAVGFKTTRYFVQQYEERFGKNLDS